MAEPPDRRPWHGFVWADLATGDDLRALQFYRQLFGWTEVRHLIGGGTCWTLERDGRALASLYRLADRQVASGVPSHWIPYVSTPDVAATAARAVQLAGAIVVHPQDFPGVARVCLIADPTGAILGLWQGQGRPRQAGEWPQRQASGGI